jgi:hypothetical protein
VKQHPEARALLREIDSFLDGTGMLPTQLGRAAVNDGNFVARLRRGRTPKLHTIDAIRGYMLKKLKETDR